MIRLRENGGGLRRRLVAGAALGTAATLAFSGLVTSPAFAAPGGSSTGTGTNDPGRTISLTVTPGEGIDADAPSTLSLSGTNYATKNGWNSSFGGAYLLFGVVTPKDPADPGSWAPSKSGASGVNYDYAAEAGTYQGMVNYPGNTTEPGLPYIDDQGNWAATLQVPGAKFTSQGGNEIDCLVQQCGVITIGAHGAQQAGVEAFAPVSFETPAAPATATSTALAAAAPATGAIKGATEVTLTATVEPAGAVGAVEFLAGETVVGSADVADGAASLATKDLPAGASKLSARFVPADAAAFAPSASPATPQRTVRVVDTARAVGDIAVGVATERLSDAELVWSVTNLPATGDAAHTKSVRSGDVTLTDAATDAERDFVFTGGRGRTDAAGNTRIRFTGSIELASRGGAAHRVILTNPELRTNAAGDGYITADLSGSAPSGDYAPATGVTVATVRGIASETDAGQTRLTATPIWEGQSAAGSWAGDFTASFPNDLVSRLDAALRPDFYQAAAGAADAGKAPRAIAVSYAAEGVPAPTGVVTGTPLADTTAYMVVEPGEQLRVGDATEITIRGYGFDPGPAVAPGKGSGGIYVGFGTQRNQDNHEAWRRSKGGMSGPVGMGDYTYGAPIFVANQNTGDGDVATGIMQADGSWTAKLTVPGKAVPSYFGDTIDCLGLQCGVFSFGAHGVVKAQNEAYTPVYFAGQTAPEVEPDPAAETATTVRAQALGEYPTDFAGEGVRVLADVTPADAAGSVEFFAGGASLGSADVEQGTATLTTKQFVGGAHPVTAEFTASDAKRFEASTSSARLFRIVDLTPAVSGIAAGTPVTEIHGAELTWSIANFVSFGSGPGKTVLEGPVSLSDDGDFRFSDGHGVQDADGNRVMNFTGAVRLTSGTMPEWNFRNPTVHVNAAGDGYITADVDGAYRGSLIGGKDSTYGPTRVTVSTFTQAAIAAGESGTALTVTPTFEGQVAAGTWVGDYTGATFPNEFLQHVNAGVRSFFLQSGASADPTKAGRQIALSFAEREIPAATLEATPSTDLNRSGATVTVTGSGFDTSAKPTYPGAPDAPAGAYVSLGWISNDGWKPSEGATSEARAAVATKWVQETEQTGDKYVKWTRDALGRASFSFAVDDVTYADVLAKKPATGDYRLAVFSIGAGGVKQAANEFAIDIEFASAQATVTNVEPQVSGNFPSDFAGKPVTVSASVAPAVPGTIEFLANGVSLGTAAVKDGAATLTTSELRGGASAVTAVFTPENAVLHEGSSSAAQTFRIVDTTRAVADIAVASPAEQITGASFGWSVANYFSSMGYEFGKEAIGDAVSVPSPVPGDKEANSNRLFTFSDGTGTRDSAGNTVIDFAGTARLTSGAASQWNFANPRLHLDAKGDGYVTAEFSGYFRLDGMGEFDYVSKRVTVATFTGGKLEQADGHAQLTVTPMWEGQVAAGTWAGDFTGSFPAEFTSILHTAIRSFFFQTNTTGANLTKPVQPITVAFTAGTAPAISVQPKAVTVTAGEAAEFSVTATGTPAPAVQWQRRAAGSEEWTAVAEATGAKLALANLARADSGTQFRAVATNAFGTVASSAAGLTVLPAKPSTEPAAPTLTPENAGSVKLLSVDGTRVTVTLGAEHANTWVGVTLHSTPRFLGWFLVDATGTLTAQLPSDATGSHKLSFVTEQGDAIGWVSLTLGPDDGKTPGEKPVDGKTPVDGKKPTDGAKGKGDSLSKTGGDLAPIALAGGASLLLVAGALAFVVARRRASAAAK